MCPPPSWSLVRIRITHPPSATFSRNFLNLSDLSEATKPIKQEKFQIPFSNCQKFCKIFTEDLHLLEKFLKRNFWASIDSWFTTIRDRNWIKVEAAVGSSRLDWFVQGLSKIGWRKIKLEENCSCRGEELGGGSRSERSDDTMLSIWTASTLSIACGEPFKFKPSMRRCLSCSSLVDGKLWSNLDYTWEQPLPIFQSVSRRF